ncbi:MAG: hypothetical protein KGI54_09485 [Pseudomonadota bacterium]|nr:hypothetical protein [Pseudomonadota bacterium]
MNEKKIDPTWEHVFSNKDLPKFSKLKGEDEEIVPTFDLMESFKIQKIGSV